MGHVARTWLVVACLLGAAVLVLGAPATAPRFAAVRSTLRPAA